MPPMRPELFPEGPAVELYSDVMDMQDQAFTAGHYETSYHLLAAALHLAEDLVSVERLSTISRLCDDRQSEAGNSRRFEILATIARATIGRLNAGRALKQSRELWDEQKASIMETGSL